ncbi:MAG: 30S ribosomal protein S20 [Thiotrichaceae bacterium]|nr:30S ribosomal protein S20 [Thiotrichaceae bacterium]
MPNIKQAKKRARQAEGSRQLNKHHRSKMRTSIKKVQAAIEENNKDAANAAFKDACPVIDSMVNKGILHKNNAARKKQRLNGHIKAL